ncbi:cleavage and polyadenylation specificity factor, putative [Plasmodium berghei]|uniref:Cleavage and polyadenylation specificity factor subunit 3, putative n=2 Tax=Plasmodium berghei TaxID=5821 RepID=A0A509AVM2_PLABA|nr:cleavage and polyadenylation specificity factor subunit 3, putative [Plasmodium berghei ANKA]CXI87795.1 cleavage and polyadenylation specificity factor, putative [Plasmodium berghei]SCL95853.1 cleavage and polyadenylation specificity factor, putative [Plasmodium berghei]SCM16299.1 cleavage and polyadenylation specificity factor, putative [Plasmodium berghei]SCN27522.1 cleavage and polyadenylation specificity factor, putative [Plasmodium berghei]VUC57406.1 cleavage and polyadenylation specif|eukprot:XP_034423177.1 cleavage and polyadenylation specificity factor subunit 3, putative [Plasmodium berghei ANKA]
MSNINIVCLGGASEVGRSCVIIESEKTSIMLDCGIHPAFMGIGCLPIYDAYDISKIDVCLITHFHMDHSGALPYLINKTRFKGRVFMTEATKGICYLLWSDYARIEKCMNLMNKNKSMKSKKELEDNGSDGIDNNINNDGYISNDDNDDAYYDNYIVDKNNDENSNNVLYDDDDIDTTMELIETVNFHENIELENVKFTAYRAGHVIGACMFLVEINNIRLLYTGDYSREIDRHIPIAEIPNIDVHVLICEGTYGIKVHDNRRKREAIFLNMLTNILNSKGKVLLPVFALGRAQEILLILEEHWNRNPNLQKIPIFYISSMATKSLCIYETYINLCSDFIKKIVNEGKNPFNFKYVKYAKSLDSILNYLYQDNYPCVVMASPGMLQSGISKSIFNIIASDKKSGVIITGYTIKGTLADELKTEPEFVTINDKLVKRKCQFEQISFSAHSDFNQTKTFIEKLKCPNVVLVHGDRNELNRLKNKLIDEKKYLSVFTPEILQKVSFHFEHNDHVISLGKLSHHIKKINKKIRLLKKKNQIKLTEKNELDNTKVIEDEQSQEDLDGNEKTMKKEEITENIITKKEPGAENTPTELKKINVLQATGEEMDKNNAEVENEIEKEEIEAIIISEPQSTPVIVFPSDIHEHTNLKTALIDQTINIRYPYKLDALYNVLSNVYEDIFMEDNIIFVKDIKILYCEEEKVIKINWLSSLINDMVADSINFLILEFMDTMASSKKCLPICNNTTDTQIYEMIVDFVEENYTNVERILKRDIKQALLLCSNKNGENIVREKNDENYSTENPKYALYEGEKKKINMKNSKNCNKNAKENINDSNLNENELTLNSENKNSKNINFEMYDNLFFDYIKNTINEEKYNNEYDDICKINEIGEILKFEVKDNANNDVQVFVDMDNREIICKEEYVLIKVKEILRNIEESMLPMCF